MAEVKRPLVLVAIEVLSEPLWSSPLRGRIELTRYRASKTAPKIMMSSAGSDTITVPPASVTIVLIM